MLVLLFCAFKLAPFHCKSATSCKTEKEKRLHTDILESHYNDLSFLQHLL